MATIYEFQPSWLRVLGRAGNPLVPAGVDQGDGSAALLVQTAAGSTASPSVSRIQDGASATLAGIDPGGDLRTTTGGATTVAIAAATVANTPVKATPGRLCKVMVTVAGTVAMNFTDGAAGTIIGIIPANTAVGTVLTFDMPAANSILAIGSANNPGVTVSIY